MFYMTLGSLFLIIFGANIVYEEVFDSDDEPFGHPVKINTTLSKVN